MATNTPEDNPSPFARKRQEERLKHGREVAELAQQYPSDDWQDIQEFTNGRIENDE